jgi:hypothetical protein
MNEPMSEKDIRGRTHGRGEVGSAMIIALLLTVLLLSLGVALLSMSETESVIAANDQWSEGAFQAAEAAVQVSLDQLAVGSTDGVVDETELGQWFSFRSGGRDADDPQPPQLIGVTPAAGYTMGSETGYGGSSYYFLIYQINGTGTGPRNTQREVEVQVELGPVAQ